MLLNSAFRIILKFLFTLSLSVMVSCGGQPTEDPGTQLDAEAPGNQAPVGSGPKITSFVSPSDGTYSHNGGVLLFQLNYDQVVDVTGLPQILVQVGTEQITANYQSGSGTSGLEFAYTVTLGDQDLDGIAMAGFAVQMNGGSIISHSTGELADTNFALFLTSLTGVFVDTSTSIVPAGQVQNVSTAPTTINSELRVAWTVPADNGTTILNYVVQYRESGSSSWVSGGTPAGNSMTITGLSSGTPYEIRVAANNGLLGSYSEIAIAEIFDIMGLNPIAWLSSTNVTNGGSEPSNGDKVASWVDITGLATNAIEPDVNKQPTYQAGVQNGLPAIRFDNLDRGLSGTFTRSVGEDLTFIIVGQFDNGSSDKCLFEFKGPGSERGFFIDRRYASNTRYSPEITKGSFALWRIQDDGVSATVTENSTQTLFSGNTYFGTDFTGSGTYILGDDATGSNRMNGFIGEFLVFDRALTATEIATLETYLKSKWGL
ncbi:MAG: fibronectin type III domain-containing protein [Bdellovibrionales bacterium]